MNPTCNRSINNVKKSNQTIESKLKEVTCDFSIVALCLSHIGLISRFCSRSLSPCWKNSSIKRSTQRLYNSSGLVGLLRSAQCTKFCKTYIWQWVLIFFILFSSRMGKMVFYSFASFPTLYLKFTLTTFSHIIYSYPSRQSSYCSQIYIVRLIVISISILISFSFFSLSFSV